MVVLLILLSATLTYGAWAAVVHNEDAEGFSRWSGSLVGLLLTLACAFFFPSGLVGTIQSVLRAIRG